MAERELLSMGNEDLELERIKHIQEQVLRKLERSDISDPEAALNLLKSIQDPVERRQGTAVWAWQEFLFAKVLATKNDAAAELSFDAALKRTRKLSNPDLRLSLLCHKSFGKFLSMRKQRLGAQREYEAAEQLAMQLGLAEELADVHLKMIELALGKNGKRDQRNFETFKKVARRKGCTMEHQHRAWVVHIERLSDTQDRSLYMRDSVEFDEPYFQELLDSVGTAAE